MQKGVDVGCRKRFDNNSHNASQRFCPLMRLDGLNLLGKQLGRGFDLIGIDDDVGSDWHPCCGTGRNIVAKVCVCERFVVAVLPFPSNGTLKDKGWLVGLQQCCC